MTTANLNVNIDAGLLKESEELFSDLGLSMATAVTVFLKQAVRFQEIPFKISRHEDFNEETLQAFEECEDIIARPEKYKAYNSFGEILEELEEEVANEK